MPGGTFKLTGTLLSSGANVAVTVGAGSPSLSQAAATDADSKYINCPSGAGNAYVVRVDTATTSWVLTGNQSGTYAFASLPAGFVVTSAQLNYGGANATAGNTNFYGGSDAFINANATANVEFDSSTTASLSRAAGNVSPATPFVDLRFPGLSALSLNNNGYGFRFTNAGGGVSFQVDVLTITGTYDIVSTSWTLPITTNIKAGDKVTINNPANTTPDLTSITQLKTQFVDSNGKLHINIVFAQDFISQSPTQIVFYFPQFGPADGTVYLVAVGDGIQFTGTVPVGTLTVIFADASGIYQLISGKGDDTIYDRATSGAIKKVSILDPFANTGFLP